jgi:hypothetical protein
VSDDQAPNVSNRRVLHASCTCAGVARGFTNVVLRKLPDGHIEIDPHVTGTCVLTLDESGARDLCATVWEWLG